MIQSEAPHIPVMLDEVLQALSVHEGELIVDGTFGAGGYSKALLKQGAKVIAFDRDPHAVEAARSLLEAYPDHFHFIHADFGTLERALKEHDISNIHGLVMDIGVSSMQLDEAARGFSFMREGPLDMRMSGVGLSACDLIHEMDEEDLANLIYHYGEERQSRRLAAHIVAARKVKPLKTTKDLSDLICELIKPLPHLKHPATKVFQALRMAVNDELGQLLKALCASQNLLYEGGRLVVVSFHSLEDRLVKRFLQFMSKSQSGVSRYMPDEAVVPPPFKMGVRKALKAQSQEVKRNMRARSAKLRWAVRLSKERHLSLSDEDRRFIMGVPALDFFGLEAASC